MRGWIVYDHSLKVDICHRLKHLLSLGRQRALHEVLAIQTGACRVPIPFVNVEEVMRDGTNSRLRIRVDASGVEQLHGFKHVLRGQGEMEVTSLHALYS